MQLLLAFQSTPLINISCYETQSKVAQKQMSDTNADNESGSCLNEKHTSLSVCSSFHSPDAPLR